jgi:hypothetical protein
VCRDEQSQTGARTGGLSPPLRRGYGRYNLAAGEPGDRFVPRRAAESTVPTPRLLPSVIPTDSPLSVQAWRRGYPSRRDAG